MSDWEDEPELAQKIDWALWRRILGHARPYLKTLGLLAGSGLAMAVIDSVLPIVTGLVLRAATREGDGLPPDVLFWGGVYFCLGILIAFFVRLLIRCAGHIASHYAHDLRRETFTHLQALSLSYFDQRPVGWLMARLTSDVGRIASLLPWFLLDLVWGTLFISTMAILMLILNLKLALIVLGTVPPLALVSVIFQRKLILTQRSMRKSNSKITASFNEGIVGARTTKALVREEENLREFQELSTEMFEHSMRNATFAAAFLPLVVTISSFGVGLALWAGGIELGDSIDIAELIVFMQYAALLSQPIQELAARFTELQAAQASAERIQQVLDEVPKIVDSKTVKEKIAAAQSQRKVGTAIDGEEIEVRDIEFVDVDFAYKPEEPVLEKFNLRVEAGETIALVGETGSGKTTITSLLGRFYEPTAGEILFNGRDYRTRSLRWLEECIGIVMQTPQLFSGSVIENIRYGKLEATDAEVVEAADRVGARPFLEELDEGFLTDVGENGHKLSIGQRQFVSLARAIIADPQILILDEATSSVDPETERQLQRGIEAVLAGRTSFVVAHRLSTIRSADRIVVLKRGKIVESGPHSDLLERRGAYFDLYTHQFSEERRQQLLG